MQHICLSFRTKFVTNLRANFLSRNPKTVQSRFYSREIKKTYEGAVLGIGSPLLDITVYGVPESIFQKYGLKDGESILAETTNHAQLFEELSKYPDIIFTAGGSAQNTIRATQWMIQKPGVTSFVGSIGADSFGTKLRDLATLSGVNTFYMTSQKYRTGLCAVLVKNGERTLIANLGASTQYRISHFESDEVQEAVEKAKYFYSESFFVVVSHDTLMKLGKHVVDYDKHFLFNLSATFLIEDHWDKVSALLPSIDVIIGNDTEAAAVGKKIGKKSFFEIAKYLADYPKANSERERTVIITQGVDPTLVYKAGHMNEYPVVPVKKEELVDTNGAGDSFVGGYLSGYIQNKPIGICVALGQYCARECVKQQGASFPPKPLYALD